MKPKRLVTNAMLIAMYVVLSLVATINAGNMKFTLDSLPIIVGAALFGPVDGMLIGLLGSFTNQLITWGLGPTTLLWIIPAGVRGLLIGLFAKHHNFDMSFKQTQFITISTALVVTALNTAVLYADAWIMGYHYAAVFIDLVLRITAGIIIAFIFGAILPHILKPLKRIVVSPKAAKKKEGPKERRCPYCKAPISEDAEKCEYCGTKF
ncbi:MAG: folate family ECF transporter S component [Oscillospiraceae bacterium]|nr:folate family ECF transporter S component [Oscillospiraceae bacterium]